MKKIILTLIAILLLPNMMAYQLEFNVLPLNITYATEMVNNIAVNFSFEPFQTYCNTRFKPNQSIDYVFNETTNTTNEIYTLSICQQQDYLDYIHAEMQENLPNIERFIPPDLTIDTFESTNLGWFMTWVKNMLHRLFNTQNTITQELCLKDPTYSWCKT